MSRCPGRVGRLLAVLALLILVEICAVRAAPAQEATADDVARFLAGMPPSAASPLAAPASEASWQQHARAMDATWATLERRQLGRIRHWRAREIPAHKPTLLYMFSGPDYLFADAFFPEATTYVLAGLEPVGPVPLVNDATRRGVVGSLPSLRTAISSVVSYSFFVTKSMKTDLAGTVLKGTLPPMLVFLARSGKTVHEIALVELSGNGIVSRRGKAAAGSATQGVEIVFSSAAGGDRAAPMRKLYYFQTDLSDAGTRTSGLPEFIASLGKADSFIKSASYLPHAASFSRVRELLIERSSIIVQDDTGIPVHMLKLQDYEIKVYGRYLGPIPLGDFKVNYQPRLAELYRRPTPQIDFGIGYRWRPSESNVLVAIRRDKALTAEQAAEEERTMSVARPVPSPAPVRAAPARSKRPAPQRIVDPNDEARRVFGP